MGPGFEIQTLTTTGWRSLQWYITALLKHVDNAAVLSLTDVVEVKDDDGSMSRVSKVSAASTLTSRLLAMGNPSLESSAAALRLRSTLYVR